MINSNSGCSYSSPNKSHQIFLHNIYIRLDSHNNSPKLEFSLTKFNELY